MVFKRGFTLVELVVVLAVISLLSSLIISRVTLARQRSRDARRVADVSQIQRALALYANNHARYPVQPGYPAVITLTGADAVSTSLQTDSTIPRVPADPGSNTYSYTAADAIGTSYNLTYTLETTSPAGAAGGHTVSP